MRAIRYAPRALLLVLLLALPAVLDSSGQYLANIVLIYIIVAVGMDLLVGRARQLSFGAAGTFGIGAYVTAILATATGMSFFEALAIATIGAGLIGTLFAIPAVRVQDLHLAIATLGLTLILVQVWLNLADLTNGASGYIYPDATIGDLYLSDGPVFYYVALGFVLFTLVVSELIIRSKAGRAFEAIQYNELAARSLGVNTSAYKALAFGISSAFSGLAGGLFVGYVGFIYPNSFGLDLAITFIVMIVIGGLGSRIGAILGAVYVVGFGQLLREVHLDGASPFFYGISLIIVLLIFPGGIGEAVERLKSLGARLFARPRAGTAK